MSLLVGELEEPHTPFSPQSSGTMAACPAQGLQQGAPRAAHEEARGGGLTHRHPVPVTSKLDPHPESVTIVINLSVFHCNKSTAYLLSYRDLLH